MAAVHEVHHLWHATIHHACKLTGLLFGRLVRLNTNHFWEQTTYLISVSSHCRREGWIFSTAFWQESLAAKTDAAFMSPASMALVSSMQASSTDVDRYTCTQTHAGGPLKVK